MTYRDSYKNMHVTVVSINVVEVICQLYSRFQLCGWPWLWRGSSFTKVLIRYWLGTNQI